MSEDDDCRVWRMMQVASASLKVLYALPGALYSESGDNANDILHFLVQYARGYQEAISPSGRLWFGMDSSVD